MFYLTVEASDILMAEYTHNLEKLKVRVIVGGDSCPEVGVKIMLSLSTEREREREKKKLASFDQHLKKLSLGCWIKGRIQKAVVLETAPIVRRFLTLEP
ncbi:jg14093 [Pararge aegeria aegeria]|uniref:Jg14093 protein n=1 Tax=Pararge aegeria aegeria TaxID=348720 RepID=A0A8S4RNY3_9NEOP|nr:jg14093 [Pararge aegeria aegeria]